MAKKSSKNMNGLQGRAINDLIVFAIFKLGEQGEKCSFQALVKECFSLSPKVVGLKGYSKWPDTRKLDRPLRKLKENKMITGNPATFFTLTQQGKRRAQEIAKTLRQKKLL